MTFTLRNRWKGRRCYLHLYFNNFRAAEELDAFSYRLAVWEQELKTDRLKPENEWAYQRYFTVKNTPVRGKCVIENMDSRLFIQFLALILLSKLRSLSKQDDTIRNLTIREIMEHMEAVTEIRFSGRYGKVVAEADRLQRKKSWIALAFRWKHSYTSRENRFKDAMMY